MKKKFRLAAEKHLKQLQRRRNWRKVVRAMACVVVFCTTYALILPAITMERDECTLTEHVHSESCYEKVLTETVKVLNCSYDSLGVHVHEADCLDAEGILICGEADYLVHTHSGECYDAEGSLVCGLPKVEEHEHTEDCYGIVETEPAETEATEGTLPEDGEGDAEAETTEPAMPEDGEEDTVAVRELICDKEVIVLHSHDEEDCYETYLDEEGNEQKRLICTQVIVLEHNHDESCFVTEEVLVEDADALTCLLAEGHVHAEACYDETGALICEAVENHTHGDMCYGTWQLTCGLEEHTHGEGCVFPEEMEPNTLRYRGGDYEVTVRYEDSAEIPENAQLTVRELSGEEYRTHMQRVYEELGAEGTNTLVQLGTEGISFGDSGDNVAAVSGEIDFARFFDITIWADGQEIQPKSPVEVTVSYDESVEIPDGEKIAVHFNHNGTVEILDAEEQEPMEPEAYAAWSVTNTRQTQTENDENKNVFVFRQDSFSISATINLGGADLVYQSLTSSTVPVDWPSESTVAKTLTIYAQFDRFENEKIITVKVPTGFVIRSYSAKDGPSVSDQLGAKLEIDGDYYDYVTSSTLGKASTHGTIVGNKGGTTWATQTITGYAGAASIENASIPTYGGDIKWELDKSTDTVLLQVNLSIQQELLSHTDVYGREAMGDIVITIQDGTTTTNITTIKPTATGIPTARMDRPESDGGLDKYYASVKGVTRNGKKLSDLLPVSCSNSNYQGNASGNANSNISFAERAVFVLSYPEGVYYEPNSAFCNLLGLQAITLINDNTDHTVEDTNNHLKVKWDEKPVGGGTITWTLTNFMMSHAGGGEIMGASFRADTAVHKAGKPIDNFSFQMTSYTRNSKSRTSIDTVTYIRGLVDGDKKNIIIYPQNYMRRNIAKDFGLEEYDYALGGFDVYSMLPYNDNVFYFTNPHGLKITALNLMGKNIRDIIIRTTDGRTINVLDYLYENGGYSNKSHIKAEMGNQKPEYYNEKWVYGYGSDHITGVHAGTVTQGALVELSRLGGRPGEYIAACYFIVDTEQGTYKADMTFSGFTYIGQFDKSETAGREVYLQQLEDNTPYQLAVAGENSVGNRNKEVYDNPAIPLVFEISNPTDQDDDVFGADHTTIGWTNTGVGAVQTTSEHPYDDWGNHIEGQVYYPGQVIEIQSILKSGFSMGTTENPITQNMLIDPVLYINLPKGISLDLGYLKLTRGNINDILKHKVEQLEPTTKINGVDWTTYRITLDTTEESLYSLTAVEQLLYGDDPTNCQVKAKFKLVVSPQCTIYDLSLQDIVMWDVRNTGYDEDTLGNVPESGKSGDAVESHWNHECVREDKNNFLRHGIKYAIANNGDSIEIKPLVGLVMDLGIKRVDSLEAAHTTTGFTTYDGQDSSIVSVKPGGYADVKLSYLSNGLTDFFNGTVIYVPIPKGDRNYGDSTLSYFQNIHLTDPLYQMDFKPFEFTMELTEPVDMKTDDETVWKTYYAVDYEDNINANHYFHVVQNKQPHTAVEGDKKDTWEPVTRYSTRWPNNRYNVTWVDEQGMSEKGWDYADVRMVKFVAESGVIPAGGSGHAIMTLYVHNTNETEPATLGTRNYWRAYGKAVDNSLTLQGQWRYTSVVAASPGGAETVVGQFFVDKTLNGIFTPLSGEPEYTGKKFTVELYDSNGKKWEDAFFKVDKNGAFALVDSMGRTAYLPAGSYTIKIHDLDENFFFCNQSKSNSIGQETPSSPFGWWYNNVEGVDGGTATFKLTIRSGTKPVHYIGIGLSPVANVTIIGRKIIAGSAPLNAGEFTFILRDSNGNILKDEFGNDITATNNADGSFAFPPIKFTASGTTNYLVTEVKGDSKLMTYDDFVHKVQVSIGWTSDGRLVSDVRYDNTDSAYELDRNTRDRAAFTNRAAHILEGKLFVDGNLNGIFDGTDYGYKGQTRGSTLTDGGFKVRVFMPGGSFNHVLTVNDDGSFACVDSNGNYIPLEPGAYRVTVLDNDGSFSFTNVPYIDEATGYNSSDYGNESPEGVWHNNAHSQSGMNVWEFTIEEGSPSQIHRVGIAIKTSTSKSLYATKKLTGGTMAARDYKFDLYDAKGNLVNSVYNTSSGTSVTISFGSFTFTEPGKYVYTIKEDKNYNTKPGVIYDTHTATATINVNVKTDGTLESTLTYNNGQGESTARPVFTNRVGYELPATGGAGTTSYTMGGLLMVTAAILLYIYTPKRRKEDHASF